MFVEENFSALWWDSCITMEKAMWRAEVSGAQQSVDSTREAAAAECERPLVTCLRSTEDVAGGRQLAGQGRGEAIDLFVRFRWKRRRQQIYPFPSTTSIDDNAEISLEMKQ